MGVFAFGRPAVLYNPAQVVRIIMEVTGPEDQQDEVDEANRQIGFVQDQPGRGQRA